MGFELILIVSSVSTLLIFFQQRMRGWRAVSGSLAACFAIGWWVPNCEPLLRIGAVLWFWFLLLPLQGFGWVNHLVQREQFQKAIGWMRLIRWLHPLDGWWQYPEMLRALSLAQSGQGDVAKQILQQHQAGKTEIERLATLMLYRMEGQWQGLIDWVQSRSERSKVRQDPNVQLMYLRALGETGQPEMLIQQLQQMEKALRQSGNPGFFHTARLYALAFAGQPDTVNWLLNQNLPPLTDEVKQYWIGTAHWMTGSVDQTRQVFEPLRLTASPGMQAAIVDRMARPAPDLNRVLSTDSRRWIGRLQSWIIQESQYSMQPKTSWKNTPVTYSLIVTNVLISIFFFITFGSIQALVLYWERFDPNVADLLGEWGLRIFRGYEAGVLEPIQVMQGEWWRLISATFLHAGWFHLLANMFGLYILGGIVEPMLGKARFAIGYFVTGIGSMAIVTILSLLNLINEKSVVGASGAIMGVLGMMGAIFLQRWRDRREALAAQRLRSVIMIALFQTLFDAVTPQVSMAGHLSGVILGFLFGSLLINTVKPEASNS